MAGVIYVLVGTTKFGEEEIFYCGRADNADKRAKEHQRDCANPLNAKAAYEYARQAFNGQFRFEVIADEDETNTEDFWVRTLIADGHNLYNAVSGNSVVPRKRTRSPVAKAFREVNARADSEERNTQQLSKPEILWQRIRADIPSAGELHQLEWFEQPVECMGSKLMRGVKRCEYTKFGDFLIYLGYMGPWKCAVRCTNKRTDRHLLFTYEGSIHKADRLRVLQRLIERWPVDYCWGSLED